MLNFYQTFRGNGLDRESVEYRAPDSQASSLLQLDSSGKSGNTPFLRLRMMLKIRYCNPCIMSGSPGEPDYNRSGAG